jgi:predicted RNA-binding protein with PUA-like domain
MEASMATLAPGGAPYSLSVHRLPTAVSGGMKCPMPKGCWLVKQEPADYAWAFFVKDGHTKWTGVRNFAARNHLRTMRKGDWVFYYHSGEQKQVVGLARVGKEAYSDPTASEGDWSAVDLVPVKALAKPVTLATIKADPALNTMPLVRQSRLSVSPVTELQFKRLLELAETTI